MSRYADWLRQAQNDLEWANHSLAGNFFAQTCFIAQQAAEKALKAYCYFKGLDTVRTHSLYQIIRALGENGVLEKNAKELDLYYISARYPDAFPAGAPFEMLSREQAQRALTAARDMYDILSERMA
ncbi:MAG: HEPN domain-containing protein [Desulfuromonadaceae bacterium]|nr:HEPN domain-containing protein [Desulfuromonadaceae bacterium]